MTELARRGGGEPYSRFKHLVCAIRPTHDPGTLRVAALTAYFDASGARDSAGELVVSGFVSTVRKWADFDDRWQRLLRGAGIKYFRMSEFASCTGCFAGWKDAQGKPDEKLRRPFLEALLTIIGRCVETSVSASVPLKDWRYCNRHYMLDAEDFHPYALCGWTCIGNVYQWCDERGLRRDQVIFYFEDGDRDKGHLEARAKKDFGIRLRFEGKVPEGNELPVSPLQAADFAAWHARRVLGEYDSKGTVRRLRRDFEGLILRVPHERRFHRHLSMTPGKPTQPPPGRFAILKRSLGIPSLVKFCLEYSVPERKR